MLASDHSNVRFFGALTYTVKLNNDWDTIPDESLGILLQKLLAWFVLYRSGPRFITQKLASTLVLALVKTVQNTGQLSNVEPIYCVVYSISTGSAVLIQDINFITRPDLSTLISTLSAQDLDVIFLFCTTFAEELARADVPRSDRSSLASFLYVNSPPALTAVKSILRFGPTNISSDMYSVLTSALRCYRSWSLALASTSSSSTFDLRPVSDLFCDVIPFLQIESDETVFGTVSEVLIDFMEWADKLVNVDARKLLLGLFTGDWAATKISEIAASSDSDIHQSFLNSFCSFGQLVVNEAALHLDMPEYRRLIDLTTELLKVPGYAIQDENISPRVLEFYEFFVESVLYDDPDSSPHSQVFKQAAEVMSQVITLLWKKVQVPVTGERKALWSQDTHDKFVAFRRDVAEIIESSYQLVRPKLFQDLVDYIVQSVATITSNIDWPAVEASLYFINTILQSLPTEPEEYQSVGILLDSELFALLPGSTIVRARQTSLLLIGSAIPYFQSDQGKPYINKAVPYLFQCLATSSLALAASRSIFQLCSDCASSLAASIPDFLTVYRDMLIQGRLSVDGVAKERIAGAIAEVIQQGESDVDRKTSYLAELICLIQIYAQQALDFSSNHNDSSSKSADLLSPQEVAASVLKALALVGKASRSIDEVESEIIIPTSNVDYWTEPSCPGYIIRQEILDIVVTLSEKVSVFIGDLAIRQNACAVFRAGLAESVPGPFTFPARTVLEYIRAEVRIGKLQTIQPIFNLSSALVVSSSSSRSTSGTADLDVFTDLLEILFIGAVMPNMSAGASLDPDINQGMLDVLEKYFKSYIAVLFSSSWFEPLVCEYAVAMLTAREPLVVKSAVKFWTSLLTSTSEAADLATAIEKVISFTAPLALSKAVWAICGNVPRSLVGDYAQLIKTAFRVRPGGDAQKWISDSLLAKSAVELMTAENLKERSLLIEKLTRLRGRPPTETIIKEFWLSQRGHEYNYA
ncbi:armadillo-type protein [Lipomyces oligophaga]|uniref:armadillo-type protein n=1 Tax=Lipomyces oligophaga TaxID=45792 RepID=UPI0034CF2090